MNPSGRGEGRGGREVNPSGRGEGRGGRKVNPSDRGGGEGAEAGKPLRSGVPPEAVPFGPAVRAREPAGSRGGRPAGAGPPRAGPAGGAAWSSGTLLRVLSTVPIAYRGSGPRARRLRARRACRSASIPRPPVPGPERWTGDAEQGTGGAGKWTGRRPRGAAEGRSTWSVPGRWGAGGAGRRRAPGRGGVRARAAPETPAPPPAAERSRGGSAPGLAGRAGAGRLGATGRRQDGGAAALRAWPAARG